MTEALEGGQKPGRAVSLKVYPEVYSGSSNGYKYGRG